MNLTQPMTNEAALDEAQGRWGDAGKIGLHTTALGRLTYQVGRRNGDRTQWFGTGADWHEAFRNAERNLKIEPLRSQI